LSAVHFLPAHSHSFRKDCRDKSSTNKSSLGILSCYCIKLSFPKQTSEERGMGQHHGACGCFRTFTGLSPSLDVWAHKCRGFRSSSSSCSSSSTEQASSTSSYAYNVVMHHQLGLARWTDQQTNTRGERIDGHCSIRSVPSAGLSNRSIDRKTDGMKQCVSKRINRHPATGSNEAMRAANSRNREMCVKTDRPKIWATKEPKLSRVMRVDQLTN